MANPKVGWDGRPGRKMPTPQQIHRYWAYNQFEHWAKTFTQCDLGEPSCYGCTWYSQDGDWIGLERAHLIDRMHGGLDLECNLVLLCKPCHHDMPSFVPGTELAAFEWVRRRKSYLIEAKDRLDLYVAMARNVGVDPVLPLVPESVHDLFKELVNSQYDASDPS
jgi:5-methylcytosine-specific restriction endonuclease McrA